MERYDAVIVGARCAGSTAAIALARGGWDVLLIDRDEFPSDTVSTHGLWPNSIARLEELGVLQLMQSRHRINFCRHRARILDHELIGEFTPIGGHTRGTGPRRRVLDTALLDTAREAGAEARLGEKVKGLLGTGTGKDPVRGVVTEGGGEVEARWVLGADGRASTVAKVLGLQREHEKRGEFSMLYAYWRGLPENDIFHLDAQRDAVLNFYPVEDDLSAIILSAPPEATRGDTETRRRTFLEAIREFPTTIDAEAFDAGELVSEIQPVPETIMRGFYRSANGPGWALIGDAGHYKHPSTAQGISDAIEQGLYVANGLLGEDPELERFEAWRDERAAEHYDWSFTFASFPRQPGDIIFGALERDPEAGQQFRDTLTRQVGPRSELLTPERLERWFSEETAKT
ncbi:MAG: NAD(P)/FAD-dependent oxidoreductase [Solirubrobacterales bacterium]